MRNVPKKETRIRTIFRYIVDLDVLPTNVNKIKMTFIYLSFHRINVRLVEYDLGGKGNEGKDGGLEDSVLGDQGLVDDE